MIQILLVLYELIEVLTTQIYDWKNSKFWYNVWIACVASPTNGQ